MLGIARKPRGLFGQPSYATPGIGDGVNQRMGDPGDAAPSPQRKGGVFGSGVPWADALYALGGAIGGDGGAAVQQIKQARLAPLIAAQEREAEFANWQRKEQWKRDNPQPANNDTLNDMAAAANWTPEQWAIYDKLHPVYRVGPDGIPYPMARSGGATPPTAPVGKLTPITGGAATPAQPPFADKGFVPPQRLKSGAMTSGRRTVEGNRVVGGVRNSAHLTGEAVDYDGADLNAVLAEARQLPGVRKAFIHRGHVHTEGNGWAAPYFGRNGTKGLNR